MEQKTEKELMLKALELLPQFQGLSVRDAKEVLGNIEMLINNHQQINLNAQQHQALVAEWQAARA